MTLMFDSLEKAVTSLQSAIQITQDQNFVASLNDNKLSLMKAGVIQNFEFTYELCWKFIQRWLRENQPSSEAQNPRTRRELFRLAARYNLIDNPEKWFEYGDARNITSHAYDEEKADIVYNTALEFVKDAKILLNNLVKYND